MPIRNEMQRVYLLHSMFGHLQIAIILRDLHYFECISWIEHCRVTQTIQ